MNELRPKQLFQTGHPADAASLSELVQQPPIRFACVFALAEMAANGHTKEQLDGAKSFAHILLNLGDKSEAVPAFPDKSLKHL